jgi:LysR family glycine cleavage system transcriptional activator
MDKFCLEIGVTAFPSLPALRVFAAAGRHLSFTRAADELNVTPAAVSHQVRALEEQLGVSLFERSARSLALTAAGRRLLPPATEAFELIAHALAEVRRGEQVLTVTTTPSFGARWLAPRLGRFVEKHPQIEVSIRHTKATLDLAREGIDAALRWGKGTWPGVEAELIGPTVLAPFAAPDYAARLGLEQPADLARAALLHADCREEWEDWMLRAGLDPAPARSGPVFDDENALIQAVLAGQGVALIAGALIQGDLDAARLVRVADLPFAEGYGYYLVTTPAAAATRKVKAFRAFLQDEAKRDGRG